MSAQQDGGPAFPVSTTDSWGDVTEHNGLSIRDWFAGMALQGFAGTDLSFGTVGKPSSPWSWVSEQAYAAADAMLAAREKS